MNRILVTGGAGFIGSNFIRMLLTESRCAGVFVLNVDKLTYAGNLENLGQYNHQENHKFVKADICDAQTIASLIDRYNIQAIVNFAAESHVDRSINSPNIFVDTNIKGTLTLLQIARDKDLQRFVQVSTDEVYGSLGADGKFSEQTSLKPNSPYSASKAAADHMVQAFGHTWGLKYNITRCSNNYGPYQFPEKMIPLMINNALNDKELPVYGDGLQVRDWLHVYDHCTALWKVLTESPDKRVYNIGGSNEKTNLQVVNTILEHLGKPKSLIKHVTDRPGHDRRYAIDATRISEELDWHPTFNFEQGIEETIDWYRKNKKWLSRIVSGDYRKYYREMYENR